MISILAPKETTSHTHCQHRKKTGSPALSVLPEGAATKLRPFPLNVPSPEIVVSTARDPPARTFAASIVSTG